MSKWRIGIAGIALVLFASLLPTEAPARMRIGINPIGVARMAVGRVLSLGRVRHARAYARYGYTRTAALRSQSIGRAVETGLATRAAVALFRQAAGLDPGLGWEPSDATAA